MGFPSQNCWARPWPHALGWFVVDATTARWPGDRGGHAALGYGPGPRWATAVVEGEDHHTCAAGYRVSLRLPDGFAALLDTDAEQRAGLQAAHRHAVDHALASLPFQRDHRVLFVASDRLEGEWTHHWLFAMACAPNGTWERLTQSLRQPASEAAYVHAMDAVVESARLDRLFRPAPAAPSRLRL